MKSKAKFDPKAIQQFVIDHTEKFVVGLVAALFLFFTYQSVMIVGYKTKPEELQTATARALERINNGTGTTKPENNLTFPPYEKIIEGARKTIDPSLYPMPSCWIYRPIPPRRLREAPLVYAVEQLRAIPGRLAVPAPQGNAGNAATAGKRWIVVTGLVPYKKQLAEYHAKFEGAAWNDPREDVPKYFGYFVQRAEVVPGSEPKWSKFMIFPFFDAKEAAKLGDQLAEEIADPRFVSPRLTSSMPLLEDATWGSDAVSPPQIPVFERKADNAEGAPAPDGAAPAAPPPRVRSKPGARGPRGMGGGGMGGNVPPPGPRAMNGGWNLGGAAAAPKPGTEKAGPDEEAQVPEYLLLRFFDFDVKPNKQYQYRVFLVLENPNYKLDANVLYDPELAASPLIDVLGSEPIKSAEGEIYWPTSPKAKWSQTCTADRVPGDMRLLCGPVVAASYAKEISAEARILLWLVKTGLNANFTKAGLIRGTILNFDQAAMRTPGAARTTPENLTTNCILVDLAGGEDREHRPAVPGMILVLDGFGNLVIHDEAAEGDEWDKATTQPERQGPGPGRGPGMGPRPRPPSPSPPPDDLLNGSGADRQRTPHSH